MREIIRVGPNMPVTAYKTYAISAPLGTHFRDATCQEVECEHYRDGWVTKLDPSVSQHAEWLKWIRMKSGRHFTDLTQSGDALVTLHFPAGQKCFGKHKVRLPRPALHVVRDGDWRGNPTGGRRQHTRGEHWVEDFAEHQDRLATRVNRG